jgi:tripartite-type tricarboxylate transporter receptor subunit TctC
MIAEHALAETSRRRASWVIALGGLLLAGSLMVAAAQTAIFPNHTVRIIVSAGPDIFSRVVADALQQEWRQPVVVEPRMGAGGKLGYAAVASAEPDGHTMLYTTPTFALNPIMKIVNYDVLNDLQPVGLIGTVTFVVVVHPSVPARSVAELAALVKANPGKINCGSGGVGAITHLACEAFGKFSGGQVVHVPYRDVNAAMTALIGNHVQMHMAVATMAKQQVPSGTIRALGVLTAQRSAILPDVPTMLEAGFPDLVMPGWAGWSATAGTPMAVVEKINQDMQRVVRRPDIRDRLLAVGIEPMPPATPAQFREFIANDIARWTRIVDAIGLDKLGIEGGAK